MLKNKMEVWASFTGYKDVVHYYWVKDDQTVEPGMVITYSQIYMFSIMFKVLNCKQFFQLDYLDEMMKEMIIYEE